MIGDLLKALVGPILGPLVDRIPDANERARAKEAAEAQLLAGLMSIVQGQLEINKAEAQHGSVFVAGWRPAIGWICGAGIAWNYLVQPLLMWAAFLFGVELDGAPALDIGDLLVLLGGMLGLGGFRTIEKWGGVARTSLGGKNG